MKQKSDEQVTNLVLKATAKARAEISPDAERGWTEPVQWPVECTVGPGLEGAIACESQIGYVHGAAGSLLYRGYDIFDLAAHSSFEEVSFLLLYGHLPAPAELEKFKANLKRYRHLPVTLRRIMSFPLEEMHPMAALRLGTHMIRQELSYADLEAMRPSIESAISADEDSIPMETMPRGEEHAIYEFKRRRAKARQHRYPPSGMESCYHLISGVAVVAAAIARIRQGCMPIEADDSLSHAGNFLYMLTGRKPDPMEERLMDIALILHADHGMNASTFASMVVASTLSDIYFCIGTGIAALSGPLHGGANEQVIHLLREIGSPEKVPAWYKQARKEKRIIMGFGHRVYKAYDPRARIFAPLARKLARKNKDTWNLYKTAEALEKEVVSTLGKEKKIFPNVDFYSGIVYTCMGIPTEMFTPIFAVSRVAGWTARVTEYLKNNRIFRPRAIYTGPFELEYVPIEKRGR